MCGSRGDLPRLLRSDGDLRASDAERDHAARLLREHAAAGRLTFDELEERLDAAGRAVHRRDLKALTHDLPRLRLPEEQRARAAAALREHVRCYLSVMTMLVVIWALTGAGEFWPVWPMLWWGVAVVWHALSARPALTAPRRAARLRT